MRGRGQVWAYAGAFVGGSVSVVANVAHSYRPPEGAAADWQPRQLAVWLAGFWPLAVVLAVEILARVDWPREFRWMVVRFAGLTPVAAVAAIVSYRHLSGLLDWYQEDRVTVTIGPFAVDGLMVISSGALLALRARRPDRVEVAASLDRLSRIRSRVAGWIGSIATRQWIGSGRPIESIPAVEQIPAQAPASLGDPLAFDRVHAGRVASGGRAVALEVAQTGRRTLSRIVEARESDCEAVRGAVKAGDLDWPLKVEHVRSHLRIGPAYARAAVQQVTTEGDPRKIQNTPETLEETPQGDEREQLSE